MDEGLGLRAEIRALSFLHPSSLLWRIMLMRNRLLVALLLGAFTLALGFTAGGAAQRRRRPQARRWQVCGDPTVRCRTDVTFEAHDLPFGLPQNAVIWESEMFYAIILKSINAKDDCDQHVSESDRLAAQTLFPNHKVFATRCAEPGNLFYTNTNPDYKFMAVYAGATRTEAMRMLDRVKATGQYPTANLRRMRAGFNGT